MDMFSGIVFGSIVLMFLVFVGLGFAWRGRSANDITEKKRYENYATQVAIEQGDLPQMINAANHYRRKRGKSLVTLADFKRKIGKEQADILDDANKQLRASASAGDGSRERRGF
jgi:Na+-transporting methylmalonyl-CoA/oxaloacetate decarboxylase gamma subunit